MASATLLVWVRLNGEPIATRIEVLNSESFLVDDLKKEIKKEFSDLAGVSATKIQIFDNYTGEEFAADKVFSKIYKNVGRTMSTHLLVKYNKSLISQTKDFNINELADILIEKLNIKSNFFKSSMSDSEFTLFIEDVQGTKIINIPLTNNAETVFKREETESFIRCTNEHEMIVRMTKSFERVCNESNLIFVNSEEVKWVHTVFGRSDNSQKPDGIVCPQGLFSIAEEHRNSELGDLRIEYGGTFLFGGGIWEIRDMYKVFEFKVKIKREDRGKAYCYAINLSRSDSINTYHVILADSTKFYIIESKNEVICSVHTGSWTQSGSKDAIAAVLSSKNPWLRLFEGSCLHYNVSVISFLGAGKFGRCFKVQDVNGNIFVLKIVQTLHFKEDESIRVNALATTEFDILILEQGQPHVVSVKYDSFYRMVERGKQLGVSYLMLNEGLPIVKEEVDKMLFIQLLKSLQTIHQRGRYHGDPRIQNALFFIGNIMWVDFMSFGHTDDRNVMKRRDLEILINSVFGTKYLERNPELSEMLDTYQSDLLSAVDNIVHCIFDHL